ncbi:MAG: M48 family metalloprotease [Planctomycetales bacterium]|nr:M48 family metalloprotease [Planctomycetales bacterium]
MNELLLLLAQNAVLLSVGTTLLLALGCLAVWFCKSPLHRQRISELTIAGVLAWIVLALFPLPRLLPDWFSRDHQPAVETRETDPNEENATEPDGLYSESTVPAIKIPTDGPVLTPDVTDAVGNEDVVEDAENVASIEMPLLVPSQSEELPTLHAQVNPPTATVQPSAATPSAWQFDLQKLAGLCTGVYLAGASLSLLWIVAGYLLLLRIRQTADAPPPWLANEFQSLARQAGITPPRLIVSRLCARPITWGVLWPVVVLPHSLCRQEKKSQLRTILLHELGHIAQQDSHGNLLFCVTLPLLYFHPLYWWLRRDSQLAAELVADDWAAWQTGKETYVEELVALARCTGTSSPPLVGVTGLFSSPSQFYRRMQMLLAREKPLSTRTSLAWRFASLSALAGSVALAASLAGVRPAAGQAAPALDPPPVAKPTPSVPATPPVRFTPAIAEVPATPASPVSPEEAALLAEIRQLQDKLRALEAKRGDGARAGKVTIAHQPGTKQIQIVRTDEKGNWSIETWTTDEKGQPAKILSKSSLAGTAPPAVAFSPDGKLITKEFTNPDGSRVSQIVDATTGKVIAENHMGAAVRRTKNPDDVLPPDTKPGKPIVSPRVEYPIPVVPGTSNETRITERGQQYGVVTAPAEKILSSNRSAEPANVPSAARGSQQLDLVSLANSYSDAVSNREAAAAKLADTERLGDSKVVSQQEVGIAKLAFSAADRKEQLLRKIAEVALEGTAQEVEIATALYKSGNAPLSAAGEAKTRLAILKQILGTTKPAEVTPPKP